MRYWIQSLARTTTTFFLGGRGRNVAPVANIEEKQQLVSWLT